MRRLLKVICFCFLFFPAIVNGQNYINNPYTRYGVGDLINTGYAYNRSMGGSALALRPKNQINYLNPASYTAQDTLSFLFQGGLTGRYSNLSTNEGSQSVRNMNIEYLTLGFPITRWWKFSIGLVPFSRIKYLYRDYPNIGQPEDEVIEIRYDGDGGFNEFYLGTAWEPIKGLSFGANAGYVFGKLHKARSIQILNVQFPAITNITEDYVAHDFYLRLGVQYHPEFTDSKGNRHGLVVGMTYDSKVKIKVDYHGQASRDLTIYPGQFELIDTFAYGDSLSQLELPSKFGIGFTYSFNDKITATAQYSMQNFSKGIGIDRFNALADYSSYRLGFEFIPAPMSDRTRSKYYKRMHYRIGGHYTNTYLQLYGNKIQDYGISFGLSFPWKNQQKLYSHTAFNISYEYGIRGTLANDLMQEKYHIITLGFTLHDFWFNKPKYD